MKSLSAVVCLPFLAVFWMLHTGIETHRRGHLPNAPSAKPAFGALPQAAELVLRYMAGSTVKVEQLLGEEDKQMHQPTHSQTMTR